MAKPKHFTKDDVSRIQRAATKKHGGKIPKGSFAAKVQSVYDKQPTNNKNQ